MTNIVNSTNHTIKIIILTVIVLIIVMFINIVNFILPLAPPAPTFDEIQHHEISFIQQIVNTDEYEISYDQKIIHLEQNAFAQTIEYLQKGKPTRERSVNDRPSRSPYYEITMYSEDTIDPYNKLYVYKYGDNVYYEIPYTGIYEVDENILTLL